MTLNRVSSATYLLLLLLHGQELFQQRIAVCQGRLQ